VSAPVITLSDRHITRGERRRAGTLASIGSSLNALRMTVERDIPVMGDAESAAALNELAKLLELELMRARSLAQEFRAMSGGDLGDEA